MCFELRYTFKRGRAAVPVTVFRTRTCLRTRLSVLDTTLIFFCLLLSLPAFDGVRNLPERPRVNLQIVTPRRPLQPQSCPAACAPLRPCSARPCPCRRP